MNDLEICKRIAEIEGIEFFAAESTNQLGKMQWLYSYNPLTDDALCFSLLKKYNIDLIAPYRPNNDTKWEAQIFTDNCADALSEYDENPNKAILLAIIEAHKDL